MALTDINFQEGEIQDYLVELPSVVYAASLTDINIEADSAQYLVSEVPAVVGGGDSIFIMSE